MHNYFHHHRVSYFHVKCLQLNGLQIFNICENDDGPAYAAKARIALTLDKIDLIEGGYPVDVKKYPHVAPAKGKRPMVDEAEVEAEVQAEVQADVVGEQDDEPVMAEAEVSARSPLPGGTRHIADSDDERDDDEAPPLIRRRIQRGVDEAGPSNDVVVDVSDDSDDDDDNDRPSSASADLEGVSSPPRKKARQQMTLASPA